MDKRFSIKNQLILLFGLLLLCSNAVLTFTAVAITKKAITKRIESQLARQAEDTAEIIRGRINSFAQFVEGIARMAILRDSDASYQEKLTDLHKEVVFNSLLHDAGIADLDGNLYTTSGVQTSVRHEEWFTTARQGDRAITEPWLSVTDKKWVIVFAVPVYDDNHTITGVFAAVVLASRLTDDINDIVIGDTGYCYIVGKTGNTIAFRDIKYVYEQYNTGEQAKRDPSLRALVDLEKKAITEEKAGTGEYEWGDEEIIAGYAKMRDTGWGVIVRAPLHEFMNAVTILRSSLYLLGGIVLVTALVIVFFITYGLIKPINGAVAALKDIAEGDGNLTVRLPIKGNNEISDLSRYFNQTIEKIGQSVKSVSNNTEVMQTIGDELASNMTETASAVHQISANIEGVKQQSLTQAASVTETAATIEEINRTIRQLSASIEQQASSVAMSSSAIEEMVATIASITGTLEKTDDAIKTLANATSDGKDTVTSANEITQKVAEESGSLLEASSVIQHIASQTNLLAMNAAIEAAHAGEAGKGFAVVADEIRKLAEESALQGKTITSTLKSLSNEIEALSSSAKVAGEKFQTIFSLSEQVKSMSTQLTDSMREQENGGKEVLAAIKAINMVTLEVQAGSEEMLKGSETVADEMRKLDDITRVISNSMNEMASGAVQISNAVQDVNQISQQNKQSIQSLVQEVKQFRV
ncbi:MAG: cache domain-containing protein [Treponema sp.]